MPLSLAGTCAAMWVAGFSIDNISLMALAVSVGFVVDDAIVMIENVFRNLEKGMTPLRAAIEGARQIGFTVISISMSLVAAFIPLLFMGGLVGRLFSRILADADLRHRDFDRGVAVADADDLRAFRARRRRAPTPPGSTARVERVLRRSIAAYAATPRRRAAPSLPDAAGVLR